MVRSQACRGEETEPGTTSEHSRASALCTLGGQTHSHIALSHRGPVQLLNVHQDPHQLGDGHGRVGVIQLDGYLEEDALGDSPPTIDASRHTFICPNKISANEPSLFTLKRIYK